MKRIVTAAGLFGGIAGSALAGGIDRSGQDISVIFEDGQYAQLSFGMINPTVSGVFMGAVDSGDMAESYSQFALGYRQSINDKFDVAVIVDQPWGANVAYPAGGYPLAGTTAELTTTAISVVGQYAVSDRFSLLAGARTQSIDGDIFITGGYTLTASDSSGVGYLVGAAYEIPDIALRVSLIYNSEIEHDLTGTELGGPVAFNVTTPDSVNLNFQSGIAEDTLLFGSIRYVDWDEFDITPPGYAFLNGGDSLVSYDDDTITYSLGVGRRFSDNFSGSIALGYEKSLGGLTSNLGPTDGFTSIQVGGRYTSGNTTVSGGVRFVKIGDATTSTLFSDFSDNMAVALGLSVGVTM